MIPIIGEENSKKYLHSVSTKVKCTCPICGNNDRKISISKIYGKRNILCSNCSDGVSYPEKIMFNVLKELNTNFIYQLSKINALWCKNKRYDFYFELDNKKYIIETHGEQHYEEKSNFKQSLKEIQENDKIKKELAIKKGIKEENYITIDCRKSELNWIKNNILNSKLNNIFDLSIVDWNKCESYALRSSLIKEVCDYWNNETKIVSEIAKKFKLTETCIYNYLRKGRKLNWCN